MSKLKPILLLICCLFLTDFILHSQSNYSLNALTGQGNLELEGKIHKLQPEVMRAFEKMRAAAAKEGISIDLVSAYRSYNRQKSIWNRKFNNFVSEGYSAIEAVNKIIEYSTLPGTSRHHWGTDIDIFDASLPAPKSILIEENYETNGVYAKLKEWMDNNAETFGFYLVYTNDTDRKGFKYEPWHYTYKAISKDMLNQFLADFAINKMDWEDLNGHNFLTSEFLKRYLQAQILAINPILLE